MIALLKLGDDGDGSAYEQFAEQLEIMAGHMREARELLDSVIVDPEVDPIDPVLRRLRHVRDCEDILSVACDEAAAELRAAAGIDDR